MASGLREVRPMRIEYLPWHLHVARFPLERRVPADLRLVRMLAPAADDIQAVAAAFHLPPLMTAAVRRAAQAETARHLARLALPHVPWRQRRSTLKLLLAPECETAVAACVAFEQALHQAHVVQEAARRADVCGDSDAAARLMDEAEASVAIGPSGRWCRCRRRKPC
jgi:hypothetical protein